ncbi:MAG: hypothetical protein ABIN48_14825 [Ginsengibacter sp.]
MGYSYNFKDLDFDFSDSKYLSHWDFMLSEFFNASKDVKKKFLDAYFNEYGAGPYNYMLRNYWYSWEYGNRTVSDTQSWRIYKIMQTLLDDNGKHRLGMNEFMMSIKTTVKSFLDTQNKTYLKIQKINNIQDVTQLFKNELNKIQSLNLVDIKPRILTEEEKIEALEISKYILEIKLQKSFDQVERDFNVFLPYIFKFKRGIFSATYSIYMFNIKVDITNTNIIDVEIPKFKIKEIEANSKFKEYSDKYLAYELVSIHKEAKKSVSISFLNANDIEMFLEHYIELSNGESEVSMNSTFQGEGGILSLKAQMKPLKLLKTSIIISSIKLAIYFIVLITLVSLAINHKLFTLLIFGGFFVGIFALSLVSEEFKQLKSLTKEFKAYGQ